MKKIIITALMAVLVVTMVACGEGENENKNIEDIKKIEETNLEGNKKEQEPVVVYFPIEEIGDYKESQIIRLTENPTTGYGWQYEIENEKIATIEKDKYLQNEAEEGMVGVGGTHSYMLKGVEVGNTHITFRYMRSWEGIESAIETIKFEISVDEENKIAILNEIH